MFTVCPKCSLKLSVTAADLRVAQGFVRCGRCSSVFNALAGLTDEQQSALAAEELRPLERTAQPPEPAEPPAAAAPKAPIERPSPPPSAASDEPISDTALEFDHTSTDVTQVFIEPPPAASGATGTFESIVLESADSAPEDPSAAARARIDFELEDPGAPAAPTGTSPGIVDADESAAAGRGDRPEQTTAASAATPAPKIRKAPAARTGGDRPSPGDSMAQGATARERGDATGAADSVPAPAVAPAARVARVPLAPEHRHELMPAEPVDRADRLLQAGSVLALLVLAAQIIHHYRLELADYGWLHGPLTSIYAALGMPLEPHWDVSAYEVHQLGAFAGPQSPGELTVRASVKNTAPRVQPLPLLRIIVQDRFGNRMAARDVTPGAYLQHASAGFLGAGQRVDAEIAFVDPGPNAVGFEVDACLEQGAGHIRCANDPNAAH